MHAHICQHHTLIGTVARDMSIPVIEMCHTGDTGRCSGVDSDVMKTMSILNNVLGNHTIMFALA